MAYSSVHKRRDYCLVLQLHHLIQTAAHFMVGDAGDPLQCPLEEELLPCTPVTVQILCIGTDRSQQTVQTKIRLLLKKQSDQGLHCLPFHQHLLDALMQCYIKLFYF